MKIIKIVSVVVAFFSSLILLNTIGITGFPVYIIGAIFYFVLAALAGFVYWFISTKKTVEHTAGESAVYRGIANFLLVVGGLFIIAQFGSSEIPTLAYGLHFVSWGAVLRQQNLLQVKY